MRTDGATAEGNVVGAKRLRSAACRRFTTPERARAEGFRPGKAGASSRTRERVTQQKSGRLH